MNNPRLPEQRSMRSRWPMAVLIVLLTIAAAGTYFWDSRIQACEVDEVREASTVLLRQMDRYDHSYQFATSASQDAIVRPVAELQQLLMDTQQVAVPACMELAKAELISYMGTVIRAFVAYGTKEGDTTVLELIDESETHYDQFRKELDAVNQCAPLCLR